MKKQGVPLRLLNNSMLATLAADANFADVTALYAAVGEGHLGAQTVVTRLVSAHGGEEDTQEDNPELECFQEVIIPIHLVNGVH